jgi:predicted enzyme related to lactoylglutathione lyase
VVADAGAAAGRVAAAGGTVLTQPGEGAAMALLADPSGALLGVREPGALRGADLVNRPGSFCWCELLTRDTEACGRFYHAVLDWHAATDAELGYTEWKLVDRTIAGMAPMVGEWADQVPSHWMVYFAVADCDAASARAAELGATIRQGPADIPPGRCAVIEDRQGAVFSMIALTGVVL